MRKTITSKAKNSTASTSANSTYDIVIVGAGPAGLAFATSVAQLGLNVAVVEKEPEASLSKPNPDGREIAHTHASLATLDRLGILARIPKDEICPIREAKVLDGSSDTYALNFTPKQVKRDALGFIISNYLVRKAAYEEAKTHKNITLMTGVEVSGLDTDDASGSMTLANGKTLHAPLIVAADGRFSPSRRRMGIATNMRDFGRSIIVCRFKYSGAQNDIAYECFNYERTLAMLPLPNKYISAVITLPSAEVDDVMTQDPADFAFDVSERFNNRLGTLTLVGKRHVYPLVATYAQRFVGNRFALLGDAAVGMHPVTAHGFNFGLKGGDILGHNIDKAMQLGLDIGAPSVLEDYHRQHRAATLPLYMGTNALVQLYTSETRRAKLLRRAGLHVGNMLFRKIVSNYLADAA